MSPYQSLPSRAAALLLGAGLLMSADAPTFDYQVRGTLRQAPVGSRVVLLSAQRPRPQRLDSAIVDAKGQFLLQGRVAAPGVYQLRFGRASEGILLPLEPGTRLSLEADASQLAASAKLTGSKAAEGLQTLLAAQRNHKARTTELMREWEAKGGQVSYPAGANPWDQARAALDGVTRQVARRYIDTPIGAYAVVSLAGLPSNAAFVDSMATVLELRQPRSLDTQALLARRAARRATAPGQPAPDINLPDAAGKPVALSSLRGKYVLIDFWASWCKPCRQESPALRRLYQRYRAQGFEVFSVSLDESRNQWVKAVAADSVSGWTHVIDAGGFNGPVARTYAAESIPLTLLLDPQGRILARDLRGPALEEKLAKLFP